MALERKLRIGIPAGGLNREEQNRGNTKYLLELAGWKLEGYDHRKEEAFPRVIKGDREVQFVCMKPKQFPQLLKAGFVDLAIVGEDTIEEKLSFLWRKFHWENINNNHNKFSFNRVRDVYTGVCKNISDFCVWFEKFLDASTEYDAKVKARINRWEKLLAYTQKVKSGELWLQSNDGFMDLGDLGYGRVDVVFGVNLPHNTDRQSSPLPYPSTFERHPFLSSSIGDFIPIVSAYPNLTYREISRYLLKNYISLVNLLGEDSSQNCKIKIFDFPSKSEAFVDKGFTHVVVDCVASGESFGKQHLTRKRTILEKSTAHVYSALDPMVPFTGDWKRNAIYEVAERLKAASVEYGKTRPDSIYFKG